MSIKYSVPSDFENQIGLVTKALIPLVTQKRFQRMQQIAQNRSRKICAVFENTHHAHNISAVLRTMDAFGFLDVFFIYNNPHIQFRSQDSIDRSASKWLMIRTFEEVKQCAEKLKQNGYKIALISRPDFSRTSKFFDNSLKSFSTAELDSPEFLTMPLNNDIALIFGTELYGISEKWKEFADFYLSIDMFGFCESLNVSVCAGIVLNSLREVLSKHKMLPNLTTFEQTLLLEHWISKDTKNSYEYILHKHSDLLDWYFAVRAGHFFQINH